MEIIKFTASIITWLLLIYLGSYCVYLFIFSIAGKLIKLKKIPEAAKLSKFIIYICAYKENEIILNSAANALTLDYPKELFHVCVIADSLNAETLQKLRQMPLEVLEVFFENSTKSKALHKAIANTTDNFDAVIVFDIDNVAAPNFLRCMNNYLQAGSSIVQGHRVAKKYRYANRYPRCNKRRD